MNAFLDRLGVEFPVVQAGMGGGIAGGTLAAAVSAAGGLGTVGFAAAEAIERELRTARELTDRPVAVNLLLPFARDEHRRAAAAAEVVVTFWGVPRRPAPGMWLHQVGSEAEARAAVAAGADAVIAQGVEAGGHVRGTTPALELLARLRAVLPEHYPILLAGGIAEADDVERALAAGAAAAVSGTRFVMSEEAGAAAAYRERLLEARETVLTDLFGMGWPTPHRVVPNAATDRWARDGTAPRWVRTVQRVSAPALARLPMAAQARVAASQSPDRPFFGPLPPADGAPASLVDAGALYAGTTVARINDILPAAEIVRHLTRTA